MDCIYERLNDELCYDLMGELVLGESKIVWLYDVNKHIDIIDDDGISEDDVEIISIEEKLQEAYLHDMNLIQSNILLLDTLNRWYFTEPLLNHTTIVFDFFTV